MRPGDRVEVVAQDSEWVGLKGEMIGWWAGKFIVRLDRSWWEIGFDEEDLIVEPLPE